MNPPLELIKKTLFSTKISEIYVLSEKYSILLTEMNKSGSLLVVILKNGYQYLVSKSHALSYARHHYF